jgi:predicted enzyme related to lactoylglutathione lyase
MAGKVVHFEVPADDTGRARGFYNQMFGWSFQTMEGPVEYHMADAQGTGVGLHRADQGGGIPGLFVYFDVDDINDGAQRVRDLGGEAEGASPVPGMGWYARCTDTEGNHFGLWQTDRSATAPSQ